MTQDIIIPYKSGRIVVIGDLHFDAYVHRARPRRAPLLPEIGRLHNEMWFGAIDACIIAGDLSGRAGTYWPQAIDYLDRYISKNKLYILPGNHDYYGMRLGDDGALEKIAESAGAHVIQKHALRHGSSRILAATLWTDFRLTGDRDHAMSRAQAALMDYRAIRAPMHRLSSSNPAPTEMIVPEDTLAIHEDHIAWLDFELGRPHFSGNAGQTIVVSHHGPHSLSAGVINDYSPAFHSDLSGLIDRHGPNIWMFGHSHRRIKAQYRRTELRNISVGYPREISPGSPPYLQDLCVLESRPAAIDDA